MKELTVKILFLTAIWFQNVYSAEIDHLNMPDDNGYIISMSGEITKGDYDRILSIILQKEELPKRILINESPGGDAIVAIKLGRIFRQGLVEVRPSMTCNSACAFIVFSGINHIKDYERIIGLHRPHYNKEYFAGLSLDEANKKYAELDKYVMSYLDEIGVPTIVSEKILSTPSSSIEYLSLGEYADLAGLNPPAFDEWLIARCGAMSPQEGVDAGLAYAYDNYQYFSSETGSFARIEADNYKEDAKKGEQLSSGYREYLMKRLIEINDCRNESIKKEQTKYLNTLID